MMLKFVIVGAVFAIAHAQLGGMMGMLGNMDPEALQQAMDGITPETLKEHIKNLSPQMKDMLKGFGIDQEKLDKVVKEMPDDLDLSKVMDKVKDKMDTEESMPDVVGLLKGKLPEMKDTVKNMLPQLKDTLAKQVKDELGIDVDNMNKDELLEKIRNMAVDSLKEQGIEIDPEDQEGSLQKIKTEMKKVLGADPDMSDEDFKKFIGHDLFTMLKEDGFNVDPEHPDESMETLKEFAVEKAKEWGFDISNGIDFASLKEQAMNKMREHGVPIDDPEKMIPYVMEKIQTFMPLIQNIMSMVDGQQQMMARPMPAQSPIELNLEINVDEGDHPTTVGYPYGRGGAVAGHMMDMHRGLQRGMVGEEEVLEVMQDLLYYRTLAKQLMMKNQILQNRLARLTERPVMSRSPMLTALLQKV